MHGCWQLSLHARGRTGFQCGLLRQRAAADSGCEMQHLSVFRQSSGCTSTSIGTGCLAAELAPDLSTIQPLVMDLFKHLDAPVWPPLAAWGKAWAPYTYGQSESLTPQPSRNPAGLQSCQALLLQLPWHEPHMSRQPARPLAAVSHGKCTCRRAKGNVLNPKHHRQQPKKVQGSVQTKR